MDLLANVRSRLAGLLLLEPGESLTPADYVRDQDAQGRPLEGSPGGLVAYLQDQAPTGYVQLRQPDTLLGGLAIDLGTLTLEAVALSPALATDLAGQVRDRLRNRQVRPTPFTYSREQTLEQPDHTRILVTFETRATGV